MGNIKSMRVDLPMPCIVFSTVNVNGVQTRKLRTIRRKINKRILGEGKKKRERQKRGKEPTYCPDQNHNDYIGTLVQRTTNERLRYGVASATTEKRENFYHSLFFLQVLYERVGSRFAHRPVLLAAISCVVQWDEAMGCTQPEIVKQLWNWQTGLTKSIWDLVGCRSMDLISMQFSGSGAR